jgi:type VI secretion system protein ImpF
MMAPKKIERLAPPLMFAFRAAHEERDAKLAIDLRNARGERVIAPRRAPSRAPISEAALRREVSNDVADVLNTVNLDAAIDLEGAPEVARSVLNFGFPDLASITIDENRLLTLSRDIEQALRTFEPRLDAQSLKVARDPFIDADALLVKFFVKADLRAEPINVAVEFVAEVELDTAKIKVERL